MKISVSTLVAGTAEQLFALSQDYARRLEWDPFVSKIGLQEGASGPAVGVKAYSETAGGMHMFVRYIAFEPGRVAAITMEEGPRLLASFSGGWAFRQHDAGTTRVTFNYNFRMHPAWLRWLVEPLVGLWFKREMRARLLRFREWVEEGRGRLS